MLLPLSRNLYILKFCTACVFFGRAYEHIFFDAPYRSILWDEALFSPILEKVFDKEWEAYVTNISIDEEIQNFIIGIGFFYFICGIASVLLSRKNYSILKYIVGAGALSLIFLAVLQTKSNFYHLSMFFEHSIQFGSPIALLLYFKIKHKSQAYLLFLKIIIALTFLSHGLYAVGWPYPLPGNFVTMTMNILQVSEDQANVFLLIAGCIDFLVVVLIFLPKTFKWALIYAVIWGLLTAFARIISGLTYDFSAIIFHQYLFKTIYRIPHGLVPFFTYLMIAKNNRTGSMLVKDIFRSSRFSKNR